MSYLVRLTLTSIRHHNRFDCADRYFVFATRPSGCVASLSLVKLSNLLLYHSIMLHRAERRVGAGHKALSICINYEQFFLHLCC